MAKNNQKARRVREAKKSKQAKQVEQSRQTRQSRQAGQAERDRSAQSLIAQPMLSMGYRKLATRASDEALGAFDQVISNGDYRKTTAAALGSAVACLQLGDVEDAARHLRGAIALSTDDPAELKELGLLYTHLHMPGDALAFLTKALVESPEDSSVMLPLASAFLGVGAHDEALQVAKSAVKAHPQDGEAHRILGVAYMAEMKHNKAIRSLERAIELDPNNPESLFYLGMALTDAERWKESCLRFGEAAAAGFPKPQADIGRAKAMYRMGRIDEALAIAESLIPLAADDVDLAHALALFYAYVARSPEQAFSLLERAAEAAPLNPNTYIHIMKLGIDFEDRQKVEEACSTLCSIDPALARKLKSSLGK